MSSGQSQQFCVRWNSHLGSIGAAFPQLLAGQRFVDVTLACEGHQVHCHRLVLAACSTFFENLLGENPCKHPIIILPREIKLWAIQALVDFMYKGEVNVSQAGLPDLMKCAEILKIRGLCGSDAALNLNQISSPGGGSSSSSSAPGQTQESSTNQSGQRGSSPQRSEQTKGQQNSALSGTKPSGNFLNSLNLQPVASSTPAKTSSQQKLHQQQQSLQPDGDDGDSDNEGSGNELCIKTEDLIIDEDAAKPDDDDDEIEMEGNDKSQAEDDDVVEDEEIEGFVEDVVDQALQPLDGRSRLSSNSSSNNNQFTITITDDNSTTSNPCPAESKTTSTNKVTSSSLPPPSSSSSSLLSILTRGSIRVKSNENLFENFDQQQDKLPEEHRNTSKYASRARHHGYGSSFSVGGGDGDDDGGGINSIKSVDGGTDPGATGLPSSLVYNRNTMDIYVKPKKDGGGGASTISNPDISYEEGGSELSADGFENIICSPNFPQLGGSSTMGSYQDDDYDDDFDIQILPDENSLTNGESEGEDLVYPPPLLPFGNSETSITRIPVGSRKVRTNGGDHSSLLTPIIKRRRQSSSRGGRLLLSSSMGSRDAKVTMTNGVVIPPSAFVLRNPRGNQPRSYNTDALWSALMDVKAGESIYRASQIHKVPRKTLRNWMKRWDIKSAYPMPRQLKEAAEKKRIIKELTEQAQQVGDDLMQYTEPKHPLKIE
ncbi:sex determination protein fruitless isoform X1 [Armigeres subalbatus]|uniref:sex determination protein fruitless isoform X1 n=1 Tax=Armigeres subalbatus TaxID=124917 RepID=UPI002ED4D258